MSRRYLLSVFIGIFLISSVAMAAGEGFPGRAKYPEVPIYDKAALMQNLQQVVVVDARSSLEFATLRVKGALNIPVASKQFETEVQALRTRTARPIVFYCNGRTCMKSYLAVKKSMAAGVKNVYAYDAGMFEWVETYPEYAELLGKSPVDLKSIISMASFKQHLLTPDDFTNKAYELGASSLVLDVRDKYQRGAAGLFPGKERWVSLDKTKEINAAIEKAKKENKTLFIYDEVGHQVQWLQYTLERDKVPNYYFMSHGARAYYAEMMKQFGIKPLRM